MDDDVIRYVATIWLACLIFYFVLCPREVFHVKVDIVLPAFEDGELLSSYGVGCVDLHARWAADEDA